MNTTGDTTCDLVAVCIYLMCAVGIFAGAALMSQIIWKVRDKIKMKMLCAGCGSPASWNEGLCADCECELMSKPLTTTKQKSSESAPTQSELNNMATAIANNYYAKKA